MFENTEKYLHVTKLDRSFELSQLSNKNMTKFRPLLYETDVGTHELRMT